MFVTLHSSTQTAMWPVKLSVFAHFLCSRIQSVNRKRFGSSKDAICESLHPHCSLDLKDFEKHNILHNIPPGISSLVAKGSTEYECTSMTLRSVTLIVTLTFK